MLYSIIPPEYVWAAGEWEARPGLRWIRLSRGRLLCLRPDGDGGHTVERLSSTDPRDYLDPVFQPGRRWTDPPERR